MKYQVKLNTLTYLGLNLPVVFVLEVGVVHVLYSKGLKNTQ